jgi:hypothetical protein
MRCTMHVCITAVGKAASTALSSPLRPSPQTKKMSSTPRFLSSVRILVATGRRIELHAAYSTFGLAAPLRQCWLPDPDLLREPVGANRFWPSHSLGHLT